METLKLSKYFEMVNPEYTNIRIIPHRSIRNYNSSNIAKAINATYKKLEHRIKVEQRKIFFQTKFKISYIIDISNTECSFYFIVPIIYKSLLLDKICEIWKKATIEEVDKMIELVHLEEMNKVECFLAKFKTIYKVY